MRRILWNIYAWPITLLLVAVYFDIIHEFKSLKVLDVAISIPSLLALHFHIWDIKVGTSFFWKPYILFFVVWEFAYNLILDPMSRGEKFKPVVLIVWVLLLPLYFGMIRYAFRRWTESETHNQEDAPDLKAVR